MSKWSSAVDALFENNNGEPVSFVSLAEVSALEKQYRADLEKTWNMSKFQIEPKVRPNEPIKDDHSPCQRTLKHLEAIKARWHMDGLSLKGQAQVEKPLTDAERCQRFNNSKASHGLTRLEYTLKR